MFNTKVVVEMQKIAFHQNLVSLVIDHHEGINAYLFITTYGHTLIYF